MKLGIVNKIVELSSNKGKEMKNNQFWNLSALVYFLIAAIFGVVLRFIYVEEIPWLKFKNILHAHSHTAMLGWGYLILFSILLKTFIKKTDFMRSYQILFVLSSISVVGMIISFPIQGYGLFSIIFSSLHLILSYFFMRYFLKDLNKQEHTKSISTLFAKSAIWMMAISTLGVWFLAPAIGIPGKHSAFYYHAIQFFLHFQFNGWFTLSVIALFLKFIENKGINLSIHKLKLIWKGFIVSCFLTYALSITWTTPLSLIFYINTAGVIIQAAAFIYLFMLILPFQKLIFNKMHQLTKVFILLAIFSITVKILIQASLSFPQLATLSYSVRNLVIGFLHLILIGSFSFFILGFCFQEQMLAFKNKLALTGWFLLIPGFILTELILFYQGFRFILNEGFFNYYYETIFVASLLLPIALLLALAGQFKHTNNKTNLTLQKINLN